MTANASQPCSMPPAPATTNRSSRTAAATAGDVRPIDGGRLTLTSFPTVAVNRMASVVDGFRVAPWPRVYVDLTRAGVRGEQAAEHLREIYSER